MTHQSYVPVYSFIVHDETSEICAKKYRYTVPTRYWHIFVMLLRVLDYHFSTLYFRALQKHIPYDVGAAGMLVH
jgi:hypothetical protein